jgi:hypothetical protein
MRERCRERAGERGREGERERENVEFKCCKKRVKSLKHICRSILKNTHTHAHTLTNTNSRTLAHTKN